MNTLQILGLCLLAAIALEVLTLKLADIIDDEEDETTD